jgi:hypothetical protein
VPRLCGHQIGQEVVGIVGVACACHTQSPRARPMPVLP